MSLQRTSISWLMFAGLKLVPKRSARPRFFVFALSSSWSKLMPVMPSIVKQRDERKESSNSTLDF